MLVVVWSLAERESLELLPAMVAVVDLQIVREGREERREGL